MTDPVFFVAALPPAGAFELGGDEGRHAAVVKRLRAGEQVVLADGVGHWARGTVTGAGGHGLALTVGAEQFAPEPALRVVLVQALPKGEHSDLAVDLATQAGIDEIVPWQAERCVARWAGPAGKEAKGRARWQRVVRESAKQSRRPRIPPVAPLADLDQVVARVEAADAALALHEASSIPLAAAALPTRGELVLVVGPEGGLSDGEIERLAAAGARAVRLGPEVLRASAAAAVALGAVGVAAGRWS